MGDQKSSNTAICSLFGTIADAQQHCIAVIKQEADDSCSMDDDDDMDENNRGHDMLGGGSGGGGSNDLVDSESLVNSLVNSSKNNNKMNSDRFSTPRSSSNTPTSCLGVATCDAPKSGPGIGGSSATDELAAGIKRALHQQHQQHLQITARLFSACNNKSFAAALENCNSVINAAAASSNLADNCIVGANVPNNNNNSNNTNNNNHLGNVTNNSNNSSCSNNNGSSSGAGNNYLLPCPLCEVPLEPRVFRQHLDRHYPRDSPICPVIQCGRRFAHPNSVRNHMRLKHTLQWAKMKAMRSSGGPFTGIP